MTCSNQICDEGLNIYLFLTKILIGFITVLEIHQYSNTTENLYGTIYLNLFLGSHCLTKVIVLLMLSENFMRKDFVLSNCIPFNDGKNYLYDICSTT